MLNEDTVEIFRNRKTGDFRIQPFARTKFSAQPFGKQTIVPGAEAEECLLPAVIKNLEMNSSQRYVQELIPRSSEQESRRSLREDQLIYVRRSSTKYRIIPFRRMGNSWGTIEELEVSVSEEEFLKRGWGLIKEIFNQMP